MRKTLPAQMCVFVFLIITLCFSMGEKPYQDALVMENISWIVG